MKVGEGEGGGGRKAQSNTSASLSRNLGFGSVAAGGEFCHFELAYLSRSLEAGVEGRDCAWAYVCWWCWVKTGAEGARKCVGLVEMGAGDEGKEFTKRFPEGKYTP
jgi:hypothetical protein